ncbi:MAG: hypothetical protein ACREQW_10810 [Candidatus Binatia bacterium]
MEQSIIALALSLLVSVGVSLGIFVPIIRSRGQKRVKKAITAAHHPRG